MCAFVFIHFDVVIKESYFELLTAKQLKRNLDSVERVDQWRNIGMSNLVCRRASALNEHDC